MTLRAAATLNVIRLDYFFNARQMFGQMAPVGFAWCRFGLRWINCFSLGMDSGHRRFDVFQCQFILVWITLLWLHPEQRSLEVRDQLCQPRILVLLTQDNCLQKLDVIRKIGGVYHGRFITNPARKYPPKYPRESLCRS